MELEPSSSQRGELSIYLVPSWGTESGVRFYWVTVVDNPCGFAPPSLFAFFKRPWREREGGEPPGCCCSEPDEFRPGIVPARVRSVAAGWDGKRLQLGQLAAAGRGMSPAAGLGGQGRRLGVGGLGAGLAASGLEREGCGAGWAGVAPWTLRELGLGGGGLGAPPSFGQHPLHGRSHLDSFGRPVSYQPEGKLVFVQDTC